MAAQIDFDYGAGMDRGILLGYAYGMKTAISIDQDLFHKAERLARRMKKSRSRLFCNAVEEYVARHAPDSVTEAMDRTCAQIEPKVDSFVSAASSKILERCEW